MAFKRCVGILIKYDMINEICKKKKKKKKNAKLISAFVFATRIVQFLFFLNPKFQASSSFLCLYRPVCVGPVRKPHCWFSHEATHMTSLFSCGKLCVIRSVMTTRVLTFLREYVDLTSLTTSVTPV